MRCRRNSVREIALDYTLKSNDAKSNEELVEKSGRGCPALPGVGAGGERASKAEGGGMPQGEESLFSTTFFAGWIKA